MRVSFDMDGTLVDCDPAFLTERRVAWFLRPFFPERLRTGTLALMRELAGRGCAVWIYTTSERTAVYLHTWFRALGVRLDGVVNRAAHDRVARGGTVLPGGPRVSTLPGLVSISISTTPRAWPWKGAGTASRSMSCRLLMPPGPTACCRR